MEKKIGIGILGQLRKESISLALRNATVRPLSGFSGKEDEMYVGAVGAGMELGAQK